MARCNNNSSSNSSGITTKDVQYSTNSREIADGVFEILYSAKGDSFFSGMTKEIAAGFCGNFDVETIGWQNKYIEKQIGDRDGQGLGLAQWRGSRITNLKKLYPETYTDWRNQAKFVLWEVKNQYQYVWNKIKGSTDVKYCTQVIMDQYEVTAATLNKANNPDGYDKELNNRYTHALDELKKYNANHP